MLGRPARRRQFARCRRFVRCALRTAAALVIVAATGLGGESGAAEPRAFDAAVPGLTPAEVRAGWIALFDGRTTFGWTGAELHRSSPSTPDVFAELRGGRTSTEFADFTLVVDVAAAGTLRVGDARHRLEPGRRTIAVVGAAPRPIELEPGLAVRAIGLKSVELKPLFNGRDLRAWDRRERADAPADRRAAWTVEEGAIRAVGGPGAIEYVGDENLFGDFFAQVVARMRKPGVNGGLFVRNEPGRTMMGYELQLHNTWYDHARGERGYTTGGIDDRQQARAPAARDGETFVMTVVARGPHFASWVNGYQTTDWTDARSADVNPRRGLRLAPGTLQLQAHDPETDLEFHRVDVRSWDRWRAGG